MRKRIAVFTDGALGAVEETYTWRRSLPPHCLGAGSQFRGGTSQVSTFADEFGCDSGD